MKPLTLLCDNGSEFRAEFETGVRNLGIELRHTAAYSPSSNGLIERQIGSFKRIL